MRVAGLIASAVLCACGPSVQAGAGNVTLAADAAPDSIVLTLRNGSEAAMYYNLCTSSLERQRNGGWETVPSERVCTLELRTLDPAAEARYTLDLPAVLEPGSYRVRTSVENTGTGERNDLVSEPFRVGS